MGKNLFFRQRAASPLAEPRKYSVVVAESFVALPMSVFGLIVYPAGRSFFTVAAARPAVEVAFSTATCTPLGDWHCSVALGGVGDGDGDGDGVGLRRAT